MLSHTVFSLIWAVILAIFGLSVQAQIPGVGWDADDSLPPPVGAHGVVRPPLKLRPLHLTLYPECGTDTCTVLARQRSLRLDLFSPDRLTLFDSWSTDSSMEIRIVAQYPFDSAFGDAGLRTRRASRQASFSIPQSDFALSVIQGPDTATVMISRTDLIKIEYARKSPLLRIDSVRTIPQDLVWTQMKSSKIEAVKALLESVDRRFGDDCRLLTLQPGYYPCLFPPWVGKVQAGRRRHVNKTSDGFLICYQVLNSSRREELDTWLTSRQREFDLSLVGDD